MIQLEPIGFVKNSRSTPEDDNWGDVLSEIHLADHIPATAFSEIENFSHLQIIFYFDRVQDEKIVIGNRHPRGNTNWPKAGIFAQRGKNRPNKLGLSTVKFVSVENKILTVLGLDAINDTPILDIKPVMQEFQAKEPIQQPDWSVELMKNYW